VYRAAPEHTETQREGNMAKVNPIQVQKFLKGVDYPASADDIRKAAEKNGADDNIKQMLGQLSDESFQTPADVSKALGDLND